MTQAAQLVGPPKQGKILVIAITAGTIATTSVRVDDLPANDSRSTYYTFILEGGPGAIIFGNEVKGPDIPVPDPAALTGDARAVNLQPDTEYHFWIDDSSKEFRITGTAAGFFRWWRS